MRTFLAIFLVATLETIRGYLGIEVGEAASAFSELMQALFIMGVCTLLITQDIAEITRKKSDE